MRSLLISTVRGTCLLAALAASGLWVRSYRTADTYDWPVSRQDGGYALVHARAVSTKPGCVTFYERCVFT